MADMEEPGKGRGRNDDRRDLAAVAGPQQRISYIRSLLEHEHNTVAIFRPGTGERELTAHLSFCMPDGEFVFEVKETEFSYSGILDAHGRYVSHNCTRHVHGGPELADRWNANPELELQRLFARLIAGSVPVSNWDAEVYLPAMDFVDISGHHVAEAGPDQTLRAGLQAWDAIIVYDPRTRRAIGTQPPADCNVKAFFDSLAERYPPDERGRLIVHLALGSGKIRGEPSGASVLSTVTYRAAVANLDKSLRESGFEEVSVNVHRVEGAKSFYIDPATGETGVE